MEKFSAAAFAEWCARQQEDGCGYIMASIGQNPKKLSEWYFSGQYMGEQLDKANYWREHAPRVFDCQGLADGYLTEKLGRKIDVRARNNYASWCAVKGEGMIPAERRVPGAAVFKRSSYVHHVGFLYRPVEEGRPEGDWWVIEAKGVMYGVVKTRLLSNNWNLWGLMTQYFDYGQAAEPEEAAPRVLARGMTGSDVSGLQSDLIALGYSCGRWGADGEFGEATERAVRAYQADKGLAQDGRVGGKTRAALDGDLAEGSEPVSAPHLPDYGKVQVDNGRWYVRAQPSVFGAKLGVVRTGDVYPSSGLWNENWVGVRYGEDTGWISSKGARRV